MKPDIIFAATGHRPDKLGGYGRRVKKSLLDLACCYLSAYRPDSVISGMALGWDQAFATAAIALGIPFTAAIPFEGQERPWPEESQHAYRVILSAASRVAVVTERFGFDQSVGRAMQKRNEFMVRASTHVVALWNGSPGGTANCLAFAEEFGASVENLWPLFPLSPEERRLLL